MLSFLKYHWLLSYGFCHCLLRYGFEKQLFYSNYTKEVNNMFKHQLDLDTTHFTGWIIMLLSTLSKIRSLKRLCYWKSIHQLDCIIDYNGDVEVYSAKNILNYMILNVWRKWEERLSRMAINWYEIKTNKFLWKHIILFYSLYFSDV